MDILFKILGAIGLVALNAFFVAAEFAAVASRASHLEADSRHSVLHRLALRIKKQLDLYLSTCQLGITVASLGLGFVTEEALVGLVKPALGIVSLGYESHAIAVVIALAISTSLHVVAGEVAPKNFAIYYPDRLIVLLAAPLVAVTYIFYPFVWALNSASNVLLRLCGVTVDHARHETPPHSLTELRALVRQSIKGGELLGGAKNLISSAFGFGDIKTRHIMTPRPQVDYLLVGQPLAEVLETVRQKGWSRLPVCDREVDNVIGVIHVKDLFNSLELSRAPDLQRDGAQVIASGKSGIDLKAIAREILIVPEFLPVATLLARFQARRAQMAAAIDERGSLAGIVTVEDVLEELVGEIEDEFDVARVALMTKEGESLRVRGTLPIHEVADQVGLQDWDKLNVDTVNGYLIEKLGRFVEVGDEVEFGKYRARVLSVIKRQAGEVLLTPAKEGEGEGAAP